MQAKLYGRVTSVSYEQGTGALRKVEVESGNGLISIYRPDGWQVDGMEAQELLGQNVFVTVELSVRHAG